MTPKPTLRAALLVLALLATVAVYWSGLAGPFLLDDFDAIFPLARAQADGLGTWDVLRQAPAHIRLRWLSNASFLASQALSGTAWPPSAFAFKAGNLAIHLACGLLVALLARQVARVAGHEARRAGHVAVIAAALFLLHPLLVSTVLYPVQRMAQLSTLFLLACACAYVHWRARYATLTPAGHARGLLAVLGFALLAFSSKESGALAPLLVLVLEITLFRWPAADSPHRARFDTGFGLACAAPLVLGAVAMGVRWKSILGGYARRDFTLEERLLTEVHVLADYLGQIFLPRPGGMGLMRDDFPIVAAPGVATVAIAALLLAAIIAAIALRRRWPLAALGVLWFFAAHALESTFIALELVFEHRNYLALFGPALLVAAGLSRWPRAGLAAGALLAAALGGLTAQRAHDWRSQDAWLASEVANHPGSLRAGTERMLGHVQRDRPAEAAAERERLATVLPGHAQPVLLKLAFACRSALDLPLFTPDELQRLQAGTVGKDAVHVYAGLRRIAARRCGSQVDHGAFIAATGALAANRAARSNARMRASWWRFAAAARLQVDDWPGVSEAVQAAVQEENNDPRDWLLLAEARARLGDRPGYLAARQRFLALVQGRPGALQGELARVDRLAAPPPR